MQMVGRSPTCDFSRSGSHYVDWRVCIYTYCHPFVFAVEHHFCSSRASFLFIFSSLWQAAPRLSKTCEKWLAPLICEGRLHFPLVTKGVLHRTKTESLSYITFSSHTILFTRFTSLVRSVTERAARGIPTLCLALGVQHLRRTFFRNAGFIKGWFSYGRKFFMEKRDRLKYSVRALQFKTY